MKRNARTKFWMLAVVASGLLAAIAAGAAPPGEPDESDKSGKEVVKAGDDALPDLKEARGRARLLHETIHATLQIVHHRFYREDEGLPIPARTLQAVFDVLARDQNVKLRWLAVNAQAMNVDHEPQDDFERNAAKALSSGKSEFELVGNGIYRHVGAVTLSSECLKCHLPQRTSTEDRAAGLVIAIPFRKK